jgi:hypothetical protein
VVSKRKNPLVSSSYKRNAAFGDPGWREFMSKRVKASAMIEKLQRFILTDCGTPEYNDVKMTTGQWTAAFKLLDKVIPSLSNVQVQVDERKVFVIAAPPIAEDTDRWLKTIEGEKADRPQMLIEQLRNGKSVIDDETS